MKNKSSIALIIAAIALVVGLVIMGISFAITGGLFSFSWALGEGPMVEHFSLVDTPWSQNQNNSPAVAGHSDSKRLEKFDSVKIGVVSANVTLIPSDEFKIEYNISSSENIKSFGVENGTLVFKTKSKMMISFFGFGANNYVNVYYKEGSDFDKLEIGTTSGNITVPDIKASYTSVASTSGKIETGFIQGEDCSFASTSGKISIKGGEISDDFHASTTSANIYIGALKGADDFDVASTSGRIEVTDCDEIDKVGCATVSGGISFSGGFETARFNTTSGNIKLFATYPLDGYKINTSTVSGTCSVNGEKFKHNYGSGDDLIDCSTVSGDIKLSFAR